MNSEWDWPSDLPPPAEWLEKELETKQPRWPHCGMTRDRWDSIQHANADLSLEEIAAGWHFCPDWDGLLTNLNDKDNSGFEFCNCKESE